ncbi:MAG: cytochrome c [Acetobacteraceae bacterium]
MLLLAAFGPPPGAASCSGCHGAHGAGTGDSIPVIAGRHPAELQAAMEAFRTGQRPATVMNRIATGFTPTESAAIAAWWSTR